MAEEQNGRGQANPSNFDRGFYEPFIPLELFCGNEVQLEWVEMAQGIIDPVQELRPFI